MRSIAQAPRRLGDDEHCHCPESMIAIFLTDSNVIDFQLLSADLGRQPQNNAHAGQGDSDEGPGEAVNEKRDGCMRSVSESDL